MRHLLPLALLSGLLLTSPVSAQQTSLAGQRALDLEGQLHVLGGRNGDRPFALVVIGTECPISNRSVPKLNALAKLAADKQVDLFGVISDPWTTHTEAREHAATFKIGFPILFDGSGLLARQLAPKRVPTAYVLDSGGRIRYCGPVDDGWAAVQKPRQEVKKHYLADAITSVAAGKPVAVERVEPVGCLFEGKRPETKKEPTYHRDVAPILAASCVSCHRPGEVGPFTLTSYKDAARRAGMIAEVTKDRIMPPWRAVKGHGEFLDERRLDEDSIRILAAWARAGAPRGDPADAGPPPRYPKGWRLGKPDLVLEQKEEFVVPAEGDDIFRCFVIPTGFLKDRQIVGFEYKPGAPTVVHHSILFLDDHQRGRKLDAKTKGPGYASFGGIGFPPNGTIGGYAPGSQPIFLPKGVARHVRKGADIILQVHYHPTGRVERDRGTIGLYFAKRTDNKKLEGIVMGTRAIDIPPGEERYVREVNMTLPRPVTIYGVFPHMHYLGREMKAWATLPTGKVVPIIRIDDWDFRWQGQYFYKRPLRLPAGTRLDLRASYDNSRDNPDNPSNPPRRVRYGDATTDEMCFCFLALTTEKPEDIQAIRMAMFKMFMDSERGGKGPQEGRRSR